MRYVNASRPHTHTTITIRPQASVIHPSKRRPSREDVAVTKCETLHIAASIFFPVWRRDLRTPSSTATTTSTLLLHYLVHPHRTNEALGLCT